MKKIRVKKREGILQTQIKLPASKSISNRLLMMRSLERAKLHFDNLSEAEDTYMMRLYLSFINTCADSVIPLNLDTHNAGTVFRFLTAFLSQKSGKYLLTGFERMKQRPVGKLVDALRLLGANIRYTEKEGFPPLLIEGNHLVSKDIEINAGSSSQFISALMLIAPHLPQGLRILLKGKTVSRSYIDMTAALMKNFGIEVHSDDKLIEIKPGNYDIKPFKVESDWSSAAFWYQMVAFLPQAEVFLPGLEKNSLQGDRFLADVFSALGVKTEYLDGSIFISHHGTAQEEIDFDFADAPDIVPSVMTTCAALGIKGRFRGIEHLRIKESDRIATMQEELAKIGATITKEKESYLLVPGKNQETLIFNSHDDHRLAMCLAPLALKYNSIEIVNPDVVNKSYPDYWNDLRNAGIFDLETIEIEETKKEEIE
jgi:3-phosphoshikimate 1-carboxyvinyltransferase